MRERISSFNITKAELVFATSFFVSTLGTVGSIVEEHIARQDATNLYSEGVTSEQINDSKKIITDFQNNTVPYLIRLGIHTIEVPQTVTDSQTLLDSEAARSSSYNDYVKQRTIGIDLTDFSPTLGNISRKALLGGLISLFASVPFLPTRWRSILGN